MLTLTRFIDEVWWSTYPTGRENRPTTIEEKETHIRLHLKPALGRLLLTDINAQNVTANATSRIPGVRMPNNVIDGAECAAAQLQPICVEPTATSSIQRSAAAVAVAKRWKPRLSDVPPVMPGALMSVSCVPSL